MNLSAVINLQLVMFALFICGFILTRKGVINSEPVSYTHLTLPTTPYV